MFHQSRTAGRQFLRALLPLHLNLLTPYITNLLDSSLETAIEHTWLEILRSERGTTLPVINPPVNHMSSGVFQH